MLLHVHYNRASWREESLVTRSCNRLFAHEVIECVSEGREPTVHELFRLAERIWQDSGSMRSAFAWDQLPTSDPERLCSLRAAMAAAVGTTK
jgi:hypothetical protein